MAAKIDGINWNKRTLKEESHSYPSLAIRKPVIKCVVFCKGILRPHCQVEYPFGFIVPYQLLSDGISKGNQLQMTLQVSTAIK